MMANGVFNERNIQTQFDISISLAIAKYILLELVDGKSFKNLMAEFSNDTVFILGVVKFLIDMGWIKYNRNRKSYQMTEAGEKVATLEKIIWI
jgi:predicted transcriptional regulator